MIFKVFCDGFSRGSYNDIETALDAYKHYSCEYRKDFTVLADNDDPSIYGKVLSFVPFKSYKDVSVEDVVKAIEELK
jgi:hypothetical protein